MRRANPVREQRCARSRTWTIPCAHIRADPHMALETKLYGLCASVQPTPTLRCRSLPEISAPR
eukprot:611196-Rhodomonas_salina.1